MTASVRRRPPRLVVVGTRLRTPEVAYSRQMTFGTLTVGDDRCVEGLRDWVRNGADSRFVMPTDRLKEKLVPLRPQRSLADAHFKLAVHLHQQGEEVGARAHWEASQRLDLDNWNYHRQAWLSQGEEARGNWQRKFEALEGRPYYEPADLPDADDS